MGQCFCQVILFSGGHIFIVKLLLQHPDIDVNSRFLTKHYFCCQRDITWMHQTKRRSLCVDPNRDSCQLQERSRRGDSTYGGEQERPFQDCGASPSGWVVIWHDEFGDWTTWQWCLTMYLQHPRCEVNAHDKDGNTASQHARYCLLYTSPRPRD